MFKFIFIMYLFSLPNCQAEELAYESWSEVSKGEYFTLKEFETNDLDFKRDIYLQNGYQYLIVSVSNNEESLIKIDDREYKHTPIIGDGHFHEFEINLESCNYTIIGFKKIK